MWNRLTGRPSEAADRQRSQKSGVTDTVKRRSSESSKKAATRGDDRERSFNPTSTSYSSSTRSAFPNTAPASVASSHAYASATPGEVSYEPPDLIRNASLVNNMPKSRTERSGRGGDGRDGEGRRDRSSSRDKQERRERRRKSDKPRRKSEPDRGINRSMKGYNGAAETSRGVFEDQIAAPGFAQFPGQTSGGFVGGPSSHVNAVSPRVEDQFPGQVHEQSNDPSRRPLSVNQGGPGLAADYYGDTGQSVSEQPGVRIQSPSLIIGAEPHLQPASSTVAPPPEPSTTGQTGAAASFYSGNISDDSFQGGSNHQPIGYTTASNSTQAPSQTTSQHGPSLGSVAAGAAAGYMLAGHQSSHSQRPDAKPTSGSSYSQFSAPPNQRPYSQPHPSHSGSDATPRPSKYDGPSQSSNSGLYAAGAAGLAAAAYHQHYHGHDGSHSSAAYQQHQANSNNHQAASYQYHNGNSMAQRHRHQGPLAKFVDFFRDPEGVAEFEEYTEYIGVCRHCFDPRSSPRDAPRNHRYRRRRSDDRLGSNTRVDKLNRYASSSSEDEKNRKGSWLGVGIASYGLGKVGQTLFNHRNDFEDTYSVKSGRRYSSRSPSRNSHVSRGTTRRLSEKKQRRSRSEDRIETGITSDGKIYRKEKDSDGKPILQNTKRRSRSNSRSSLGSRRRRSSIASAAVGAAVGSSIAASSTQRRKSRSPKGAFIRSEKSRKGRNDDVESILYLRGNDSRISDSPPQRRRSKKAKKKSKGFFSFSNSSSSSTNSHLAFNLDGEKSSRHRKSKSNSKDTDHRKAEAAMLGLGAVAAALAASGSSSSRKPGRVGKLVGTKESGVHHSEGSRRRQSIGSVSAEEEAWESATENNSASVDSELAYGAAIRRRGSRSSMSSDSSGLTKWGWRWGDRSKKMKEERKVEKPTRPDRASAGTAVDMGIAADATAGLYQRQQYPHQPSTINSNVPLKYVDPQPVFDQGQYSIAAQQAYPPAYGEFVNRPVPIQHPQPIVPVSSVIQRTEGQHVSSMPEVNTASKFSQPKYAPSQRPPDIINGRDVSRPGLPGRFPDDGSSVNMAPKTASETTRKIERRASSPISRSAVVTEVTPKQRKPQREDSSVRFDLTEDQSEKDRRERRRRRREERERREAEEAILGKTKKDFVDSDGYSRRRRSSEADATGSLVDATAVGAVAAAGIAIAADISEGKDEKEETSGERRERRRKKRQERSSRAVDDASDLPQVRELPRRATDPSDQRSSSFFSRAKSSSDHESYATFFAPEATLARDPEAKETNSDPNVGVNVSTPYLPSTYEAPSEEELTHIVDPIFNEYGEEIRPFRPQDWVPRLKLAKPTPSPSIASSVRGHDSPVMEAREASINVSRHSAEGIDLPRITTIEPETDEVTVIKPKGIRSRASTFDVDLEGPPVSGAQDQSTSVGKYPDDPLFAATVAAGLQDAGFDPEIAINDPIFRRRDSPPGSEEYQAPPPQEQGFVEGEVIESSVSRKEDSDSRDRTGKRERKRKDKEAKRRSTEDRSAESAIIEDYEQPTTVTEELDSFEDISKPTSDDLMERVEEQPSIPAGTMKNRALEDDSQHAAVGIRTETGVDQDPDSRSIVSDSYAFKGFQSSKKSNKKSKREGSQPEFSELAKETSPLVENTQVENNGSTAESNKARKGSSLWGLFRKSRENIAEPPKEEPPVTQQQDGFKELKGKTKKSKKRGIAKGDDDVPHQQDGDDEDVLPATELGRISQDLPAQVYSPESLGRTPFEDQTMAITNAQIQNPDKLESVSFLGERPDPPPPPDKSPTTDPPQAHALSLGSVLPVTDVMREGTGPTREIIPDSEAFHSNDNQYHRVTEIQRAEGSQPASQTSSPIAVPYSFRMPSSPGAGRSSSLPQTPSRTESIQFSQRPKIRPKSTEFQYSNEFRPMWLVETHRSRQDEPVAETFPSLPSSHTTSRASSVHDFEENYMSRERYDEKIQASRQESARRARLVVDTSKFYTPDDLLDSQQATPTASSFPAMLRKDNKNVGEAPIHDNTEAAEAVRSAEWPENRMLPSSRRESFDKPPQSSIDNFESSRESPPLSPTSNMASSLAQSRDLPPSQVETERLARLTEPVELRSPKHEDHAPGPPVTDAGNDSQRMIDDNAALFIKQSVAHTAESSDAPETIKLTQDMPQEQVVKSMVTAAEGTLESLAGPDAHVHDSETEQSKPDGRDIGDSIAVGGSPTNDTLASLKNVEDFGENEEDLNDLLASTEKGKKGKKNKKRSNQDGAMDLNQAVPSEDVPFEGSDDITLDQIGVETDTLGEQTKVTTGDSCSSPKEVTDEAFIALPRKNSKKGKKGKRLAVDPSDNAQDAALSEGRITEEQPVHFDGLQEPSAKKAPVLKQENGLLDIAINTPLPEQHSEQIVEMTQIDQPSPIRRMIDHGKPDLDAFRVVPPDTVADHVPEVDLQEVESRIKQEGQANIVGVTGNEKSNIEATDKVGYTPISEQVQQPNLEYERGISTDGPENDDWADFGSKKSKTAKRQNAKATTGEAATPNTQNSALEGLATGAAVAGGTALAAAALADGSKKHRPKTDSSEPVAPVEPTQPIVERIPDTPAIPASVEAESFDTWQPKSKKNKKTRKEQPTAARRFVDDDDEATKAAPSLTSTGFADEPRIGPISLSAAADGAPLPPPAHTPESPKTEGFKETLLAQPADDQANMVHWEMSAADTRERREAPEEAERPFALTNTAAEIQSVLANPSDTHVEAPYVALEEGEQAKASTETGFKEARPIQNLPTEMDIPAEKGGKIGKVVQEDVSEGVKQAREALEVQSEPEVIPPPTESYPLGIKGNPVQGEDFYEPEAGTVKGKIIMPATEDQTPTTNISEPLLSELPESFNGDQRLDLSDNKVREKVAPAEDFEDVPISKKDKKKRKKNKAISAFDEGKAETSPQVEEPRGESGNDEQPSKRGPTSESREGLNNLVEAEDFTMKKNKKKGKKGKNLFTFDFDNAEELSQEKGPQPNPSIEQPSEVLADIPLEPEIGDTAPDIPGIGPEPAMVTFGQKSTTVQSSSNMPSAFEQAREPAKPDTAQMDQEPEADDVRVMLKSRKDKKKAKKSKLLSWDDMEDQLPTEPAPPTPTPTPPNAEESQSLADEDSLQPFDNPPLAENDIPTEAPKSKKDRKKAKKTRPMVWEEEDAVNSVDIEAPELLPTPPNDIIVPVSSTATDTVKDIPALSFIATADFENIESGSISKSKRDKKKAKKAKPPAREEDTTPETAGVLEPSTSLQDSTLIISDAPREVTNDVSAATPDVPTASDEGQTFDILKNKRDKKKAKKTKTSVGEEESRAKPGVTEEFQEPVMPTEETFPAQSIPLDVSMEENTTEASNAAAEDIADLSRGNGKTAKKKKKGNKNKTFLWNEPSEIPAADDFQAEKLEESLQEQVLTEQPGFSLEETAKLLKESSPPVEDSVLPDTEHSLPVDEPSLPVDEPSLPDLESTSLDRQPKTPTEDPTMAPEEASHIFDVPTLSSEEAALTDEKTGLPVDENPREPSEPRVAPIEPVEDSPAEVLKSKKNKENAKFSRNFAWDEPAEIPTLGDAEDLSTVQTAENPTVASEEPDVVLPSSVDEAPQESIMRTPKSKKEKKEAKKTKVISWDEPSETAGTDDLEFVSILRSIEDTVVPVEDNEALPKAPAETVDESFHEGPTSKKGKRKGKKGQAHEWGELSETPVVEAIQDASAPVVEFQEGAATPTEPITTPEPNIEATKGSELDDRLGPENDNVWPSIQNEDNKTIAPSGERKREEFSTSEALPTEPIDDFVDADLSKKSKKKGKKYKRMSSEEWGTSSPETPEPWELGMGDIKEVTPTVSSQANDEYLGDSQIDQSKEGNGAGLNVQQMAATLPESLPRSPEDDIPSSKIECSHEALTEPVEPHTVADLPEDTATQASAVDDSGYPTDTKTIVEPESELQQGAEPELNPQSAFSVKKSKKDKKKAKKAKKIDIELDDAHQDASTRQVVEDPAPAEAPPPSMEPPLKAVPGEASEATTAPLLSRKKSKKDKKRGLHNQSNALDDEIGFVGGESLIESGDAHELPQITEGSKPGNLESIAKDLVDPEPAMKQQAELEVEPELSFTSKKGKKDKKKSKKLKDVEYDEPMEGKDDPNIDDTGQESAAALKEPLAEPAIEPLTEPTDQPGPLSGRASHGLIEIPEQTNEPSFRVGPNGDTQDFLNAAEELPAFSSKKKKGKKSKKPQGQQLDLDGPESIEVPAAADDLSRNIQEQEMPQGEIAAVEEQPPVNGKAAEGFLEGSSDPFESSNKPTGIEDQPQVLMEDARLEPLGKRTKKEEKEMKSRKIDETPEPIEPEEVEDLLMKPPGELTEAEHRMISEIPIANDSDIEPQPKDDEGTVDIPNVLLKAPEDLTETEREQVSELPQDTEEQIESSINVLDPPTVQTEPSFVEVKQEKAAILEPYPTLFEHGASELPTIKEGQVLTENNSEGRVPSLDDADRNVSSGASPSHEPMQEDTVGLDNTMGDESRQKDEFPAFSTTKKSKKERNTQIWENETATPPAISDESLESDTRNQATRDMSRDVQEPPNLSSPRADLKMEPSNALDEPFKQEVPQETEIIPDDDWLASSGKNSKKSKKSKRRQEQADSYDLSPVSKKRVEKPHSTENPTGDHAADTGLKYEDAQDSSAGAASISRDDRVQSEEHRDRLGATMTGLGASAAAAALLSRKDSKKQSKKDKKKKRSSQRMDEQDEDREGFNPDKQELRAMSPIRQEGDPATTDFQSQLHEASDQHLYSKEEPDRLEPSPCSQQSVNRDSGVVVNDSPNTPENPQMHRVVRDSGYQGADDSPVIGYSPEPHDFSMERGEHPDDPLTDVMEPRESRSKRKRRSRRDRDISEDRSASTRDLSASREVIHSRSRRARPFSPTAQSPDLSDQGTYPDLPRHDGLDTERLQTEHLAYDSPREPSPVSSTTKDRSSILFHSSPSNRHDAGIQQEYPLPLSPVQSPVREVSATEATRGRFDRATQLKQDPAEPRSRPISPEVASSPVQNTVPHRSIFGEPVSEWRDSISPPQSPINDRSRLPRLDTITEHSPEESPLHKKSRALSDVGSPERGIKSLRRSRSPKSLSRSRVRSPGTPDNDPSKLVTSNDLDPRLSWPTTDEDRHSIDLERSRNRNTDKRMPSHLSEVSTPIMPLPKQDQRNTSGGSAHSTESINAIIRTPPPDQMRSASGMSYRSSGTPPLRRSDRSVSSDLRLANKKSEAKSLGKRTGADLQDVDNIPSSSTYDPVTDKGKSRVKDMADVYEGLGHVPGGSPLSPTRPPSMRRRQSMQIMDLEQRLDQVVSENRLLADAKLRAERSLDEVARDHAQSNNAMREAIETRDLYLTQKNQELEELRHTLNGLQNQVAHLSRINEGLSENRVVDENHEERYRQLESDHNHVREQWQQSTRELEDLRQQHAGLSGSMESIVATQVASALASKNAEFNRTQEELRRAHEELEQARQQIRTLQQQILASKSSTDSLTTDRDEDYFDTQCQALCQHVQQWVLRFSKSSDDRACFRAEEIRDEKICDRFENAILDGTDADSYLSDRVKRRDVFMSVFMTMVWEYIFTRYLFGMDREQRQKLKSLEKTLNEVGPASAVQKWRATTLSLLSKRDSFASQTAEDTEAVVHEIYGTLATFLPPPSSKAEQLQTSLRRVIALAIDLSIEMRTQRSEYIMLPPLQPEFDTNGDLARYVYFNANLMNERSGTTVSNEALEQQGAAVRMVLFPLVVKKGEADEEIVVCPAQVLCQEKKEGKRVRVVSAQPSAVTGTLGNGSNIEMGGMF